jgi:Tol biopolymer transport system component
VLTYDFGVSRRIIEITSGQPYYLQLLCFEVFNRCSATGWVNQRDVDLVLEDLLGREISDFRQLWHESSPSEQAALAALVSLRGARGVATVQEVRTVLNKAGARAEREQVSGALDSLVQRGILERLGALSYRFRVALLRDWLSERIDLSQVVRGTRWETVRAQDVGGSQRVPKLPPRRSRRAKGAGRSRQEPDESAAGQEAPPVTRRRWLWIALVAIVVIAVLVILGRTLLAPSPSPSSPVAEQTALSLTRPATATLTRLPTEASLTAAIASPTVAVTPPPVPSATPVPTPPLIVARSVPSIAYQSKEPGDSRWFVQVMNSDGSDRVRLAAGQSGFLSAPSWSPDGSKLAFASDAEGHSDIWVMDIDGSNAVNLTQDEAEDHSPAWSPDGHWIAFASLRDSRYWELYVMRPDGADLQRLTWWEDASDLSPSWSPDGTKIAFASKRDGNWEIYTMDRDGGNLARLTDNPADDTNPAWAPDGSRIAFVSTRDGYAEIYVMSITGGQVTNISNAPYSSEHGPTWSPDGGRIAFYSDRDGSWNIHVMASDGSDVTRLTGGQSNDQVPAWRP